MKIAAVFMAVLLALSLTGCMNGGNNRGNSAVNPLPGVTEGQNGTAGGSGANNGGTANGGGSTGSNGSGSGSNGGGSGSAGTNGGGNTGTNGGSTGSGSSGTNGGSGTGTGSDTGSVTRERSVMYNGALYDVTAEILDDDEVGLELFSVSEIVDDTPAAEGSAAGLDKGTKVYRIRDDNEYDEIAVEIGSAYYKAVRRS